MSLKAKIDQDLKTAMLAGDKKLVDVLRGIKSAVLNTEISTGKREAGLSDPDIINVLQKEAKKRLDAIELYQNAGETEKADAENYEKSIIDSYLPEPMSDDKVREAIDKCIEELGGSFDRSQMGAVIGAVKAATGGAVDGATIARLVQEKL